MGAFFALKSCRDCLRASSKFLASIRCMILAKILHMAFSRGLVPDAR